MTLREDAVAVLSKLHTERSRVLCMAELAFLKLSFRGFIDSVSETELRLIGFDGFSGFTIRLDVFDTRFEYAEPKDLSRNVPAIAADAAVLAIFFPVRVPAVSRPGTPSTPEREFLFIFEDRSEV